MRPTLVLSALALVSALAGCDLLGACEFDSFAEERYTARSFRADAPAPDTLTVVFVTDYNVRVFVQPDLGEDVRASLEGEAALAYDASVEDFGPAEPTFESAVRGDTLWVRPEFGSADALVRPACSSPVERLDVYVFDVLAPEGVRHVRFAVVDGPSAWPAVAAPRGPARRPLLRA